MPRRFITYSRTEPARTILWSVSLLTGVILIVVASLSLGLGIGLGALVGVPVCGWGVWSSTQNNVRHMANSSFWLFIGWLWATLHVGFVAGASLLWAPMLVVGVVLATVYIYLAHQQKGGTYE